ncbi:unnamed protein product [Closterium sp. Yama58-4]|nr:unnamed protein product [Closterium sp. Yama58-4]
MAAYIAPLSLRSPSRHSARVSLSTPPYASLPPRVPSRPLREVQASTLCGQRRTGSPRCTAQPRGAFSSLVAAAIMACAGPRSALQAGLAAVVAGLVALTLLVSAAARHVDANRPPRTLPAGDSAAPDVRRPSPALLQFDYGSDEYDTTIQFPWADVGFNFAACSDLDATRPPDPVNSAIVWGRVAGLPSSRVCRSVSFHSAPGCAGPPMATYLRPATSAPTTMTFPASKMPASLRCGTGCGVDNVDCGSEAKCTISDKGQECVCAGALVFDATAKQCRACLSLQGWIREEAEQVHRINPLNRILLLGFDGMGKQGVGGLLARGPIG